MNKLNSIRASSYRAAMVFLAAAAVAPFAFGCSSPSSSGPSRSGLDESLKLGAATPAQFAQLCDWAANLYGGYGHSIKKQCGDGGDFNTTISAPNTTDPNLLAQPEDVCDKGTWHTDSTRLDSVA